MKIFMLTLAFLTRLPAPVKDYELISEEKFAEGIKFFPIIGFIVGFISFCFYFFVSKIRWGMSGIFAAVLAEIFVTGAFHIDGLADTCDGIYSSRSREKMIEIMHDSRIGTNGVIAVIFDILIKIFVLYDMDSFLISKAIILAPVAAKTITPILADSIYAKNENGLGSVYIGKTNEFSRLFALLLGSIIIMLFLGLNGIIPVIVTIAGSILFKKYIEHKIGGMTGDTLGAGAEFCQILFLISLLWGY